VIDEEIALLVAHLREMIADGNAQMREAPSCPRFDHPQGQRPRQDSNLRHPA
jgi:hypothetical protein